MCAVRSPRTAHALIEGTIDRRAPASRLHAIGLVRYPQGVHAWVLDLPGCIAGAASEDAIDAPLRLAIAEHEAWLLARGEQLAPADGYAVVETRDAADGGVDIIFEADRAPVDDAELELLIRRVGFARADLLSAVARLPDALLDWSPPAAAFDAFDSWAPEVRTIRDLMTHVLQFDIYYREQLHDGPAKGVFEQPGDPADERELTLQTLRALPAADRGRVFRPLPPGHRTPDAWTLRKAVRRIISHERAHAAEVLQRWSWTLLGTPERRR